MLRDTTIDNNWWYTECQATYNIRSIDSSNAIIQFTRICASLVGGNIIPHYFSFSFLFYMLYMAYLGMLWWGVKKLMMVVHEKKPLPLVAPVLVVVVAFFNLDRLCNLFWMCRNKLCFIHLMDNVYVRHDRICIRGFHPPFDGYFYWVVLVQYVTTLFLS